MTLRITAFYPTALIGIAIASACGGGPTPTRTPTSLAVVAGEGQSGPVGGALPVRITFKASDAQGGVPGVAIVVSVAQPQGGSVAPASGSTDADGQFAVLWTLGPGVGAQSITGSVTGTGGATAHATGTPGGATSIIVESDAFQLAVVGRAVLSRPAIRVTDNFGNPIANEAVTFEPLLAGQVLTGASQTTDANGRATIGSWTIGQDAVVHSIRGRIPSGAAVVFEARGVPAAATVAAGAGQSANVGTAVAVAPAVKVTRDDGSPLPSVLVNFSVTLGSGQVQGSSALSGADGVARPTRWILGPTAGLNRLEASMLGPAAVTFEATGVAAVPASAAAASATAQSGFFGNFLVQTPSVLVSDASGNPVAGVQVTFTTTQGDGQLFGRAPTTDFVGRATLGSWRLGSAGNHTVTATAGAFAPVVFNATATAPPAATFRIVVRYRNGNPPPGQLAAFDAAVAQWARLLIAGAPPYTVVPSDADPSGECPLMTGEVVDGIVIHADLRFIDGPGRILGATGVCVVRDNGFLPVEGLMIFDTEDLTMLGGTGQLNAVILHEMAHALGFGTIWNFSALGRTNAFLTGAGGGDPFFNGAAARSAFFGAIAPGTTFTGTPVPVEAGGGPGTAYSHWRKSVFGSEIMTGFLSAGVTPLSAMTVNQFRDLGYTVNDATADPYSFQALLLAAGTEPLQLVERPLTGSIIVIDRHGRVVARVPRL